MQAVWLEAEHQAIVRDVSAAGPDRQAPRTPTEKAGRTACSGSNYVAAKVI
ncbi:hypothetical protein I546_2867 [Mycobacterium kansasii 732]|nr:hypothetical protein I546_2867 [Mycobacterium kansasii 732]